VPKQNKKTWAVATSSAALSGHPEPPDSSLGSAPGRFLFLFSNPGAALGLWAQAQSSLFCPGLLKPNTEKDGMVGATAF
jgi:hypothetical protein